MTFGTNYLPPRHGEINYPTHLANIDHVYENQSQTLGLTSIIEFSGDVENRESCKCDLM